MEGWCPLQGTGMGVSGRPWLAGWLAGWLLCPLLRTVKWMSECTWASVLHPLRSASYNGLDGEIRTMLATQARSGVREGYEMFVTLSTVSGRIYPT